MLLEIAKVKATPEAQPRVSLHYPTVEEYADALRGGAEFPPLIVFFDGSDHWLADGFHRLEAYRVCEYVEVPVDVRKGSKRDAILFSKGANSRHGLPRTNADKRRAVESLLRDPEWGQKSDRWIADAAAVSKTMVLNIRGELRSTGHRDQLEEREGKDGKTRKLPERQVEASGRSDGECAADAATHATTGDDEPRGIPSAETRKPSSDADALASEESGVREDTKHGCASLSERDAVEAWVAQGAMLYERFGDGAREYMRTSWDKRLAKLEGY